uniref:Uncharacterized protein n=1 Tax=Nelumbo nucifera TaxID=4432 RepID=A0A822YFQ6_NELNU|nr:TPA_asm: hypothetical protein HUJ06_010103 [Nelumbo nucifera]
MSVSTVDAAGETSPLASDVENGVGKAENSNVLVQYIGSSKRFDQFLAAWGRCHTRFPRFYIGDLDTPRRCRDSQLLQQLAFFGLQLNESCLLF